MIIRKAAISVAALALVCSCAGRQAGVANITEPAFRLSHVVILVEDIDATAEFFSEFVGWDRHPVRFGTPADEETTGGLELAFVYANGLWLELVEPTGPGPASDMLATLGDGAIIELAFRPDDYDAALSSMAARGIEMQRMDRSPLDKTGGRIEQFLIVDGAPEERSIRIAYWPTELTYGTSVEMVEYRPDLPADIFSIRDADPEVVAGRPGAPRMDRIAIIVEDAERSAGFYTDVLGLERVTEAFVLDGAGNLQSGGMKVIFVDAGPVALALVQPVGDGPLRDYLELSGDGHIAELIAEVDDLSEFFDRMISRGVHMVGTDGEPLDPAIKAHVLEPFGDRIAYFPRRASRGVVLEIAERGPAETSLIHARDRAWHQ